MECGPQQCGATMHRMSTSVAPCRQPEVTVAHCVKRDLRRWCCAGSSLFGPRSDHCVLHIRICESESRICIVLLVVFCAQEDVYVSTVNTVIGTVCDVIFSRVLSLKEQFRVRKMCCSAPQRCLFHTQFRWITCGLLLWQRHVWRDTSGRRAH